MTDFNDKGHPEPEFQLGICKHLKDDNGLGQESIIAESPITTILHDMIGDYPKAMFPYRMDFRHFNTVRRNTRFTYWVCYCLDHFEGVLKKAGAYEAIWASRYKQKTDEELLKPSWLAGPCTNTILMYY